MWLSSLESLDEEILKRKRIGGCGPRVGSKERYGDKEMIPKSEYSWHGGWVHY